MARIVSKNKMHKSFFGIGVIALLLSASTFVAHAAVIKPGAICSKLNQTQSINGVKFTCIKSGLKLVWNKGVSASKPTLPTVIKAPVVQSQSAAPVMTKPALAYPFPNKYWQVVGGSCNSNVNYLSRTIGYNEKYEITFLFCSSQGKWLEDKGSGTWDQETGQVSSPRPNDYLRQYDFFVPKEWEKNQAAQFETGNNSSRPPYGYFPGIASTKEPKSALSSSAIELPVSECKLKGSSIPTKWAEWTNSGFPMPAERWKVSNVNIQLAAFAFPDRQSKLSPEELFGPSMRAVSAYWQNTSDVPVKINWRVPKTWIQLSKPIESYKSTQSGDPTNWAKNTLAEADSQIDFTGVNMIIFVTPERPSSTAWQPGHFHSPLIPSQGWQTNEGKIYNVSLMEWFSYGLDDAALAPMGWIHHFLHMAGVDDNFDQRNPVSTPGSYEWNLEIYKYMGVWGNMSQIILNEPLFWDKFKMSQINDSQVICVSPTVGGTYWIRPNAIAGNVPKGIVIPLGEQKGIVIESVRAVGYNYLMYPKNQGALVYTVNTSSSDWEDHPLALVPRPGVKDPLYRDGALRLGDSVTVSGVKITVVESDEFGEVIKVEKAG